MQKKELVFVKAHYREKRNYNSTLDSIDVIIIQKLISAAGHYIVGHQPNLLLRFDVLGYNSFLKLN